jgi:hypothetical protein
MRKYAILVFTYLFLIHYELSAKEGMWLLPLLEKLNMEEMNKMGLKLSSEEIYSINSSSIKDAIVYFDIGCTGEIISDKGLLLTNHHCAYSYIQKHSTVANDLLQDGFWAHTAEEELPNPGLTVRCLISIEDVNERITSELSDTMDESARDDMISIISEDIEREATEGNHYEAEVKSFFGGNSFYLFVYEVFKDVRLVGVPPSSIGKFGYDTDNWIWPRHTGDFTLFRIYTGPDGNPAEYSKDNIPYKPRQYLTVTLKGIKPGDFSMVLGYSGSTQRYLTSYGVKELLEETHPNRIKIRGLRQQIMMEDMMKSEKVHIQYASKYFKSSNYWKYSIGQSQGLKRLRIYDKKKELEDDFTSWISQDAERQRKYGDALPLIEEAITKRKPIIHNIQYLFEAFIWSSEVLDLASEANWLYSAMPENNYNKEIISTLSEELREKAKKHFADLNVPTEIKILVAMLKLYSDNVPEEQHPDFYMLISEKYNGSYEKFVNKMFSKSVFADSNRFQKFILNPSVEVLEKDPAFITARSIYEELNIERRRLIGIHDQLNKGRRLYIAGLMEMEKDRVFYPDANSTIRLTYGTVGGYSPRDAVYYNYFTTLKGVMEKEDPDNWEFVLPPRLKELYENKDYGMYADDNVMNVCFITDNDITGGNSGSPVLNNEGQLIGLAFDGNWEAMSGDIIFESELQKCICVDIRYILFIIDKYAGASNIIDELKIMN